MKILLSCLFHNWSVFSSFHDNITSLIFSYLRDWTDYDRYDLISQYSIHHDNPWEIVTSSSPLIILICKKIQFFLKTDLIGCRTVSRDLSEFLKWLMNNAYEHFPVSWPMGDECRVHVSDPDKPSVTNDVMTYWLQ